MGAEVSQRDLKVPVRFSALTPGASFVERFDRDEEFARAYMYWAARQRLSLSAEYLYEGFDREVATGSEDIIDLETHRVPLSLRYFHSSGLSGLFKATFVDQSGKLGPTPPTDGQDNFWVLDAGIGYRLPKRYGVVGVEVKNLLDKTFRFQDTDPKRPIVQPERLVVFRVTLAF